MNNERLMNIIISPRVSEKATSRADTVNQHVFSVLKDANKLEVKKAVEKEPKSRVKEEIGELIESVEKDSNKIHEAADVIYHLMVYLEANNIKIEDVMSELKKRQK